MQRPITRQFALNRPGDGGEGGVCRGDWFHACTTQVPRRAEGSCGPDGS